MTFANRELTFASGEFSFASGQLSFASREFMYVRSIICACSTLGMLGRIQSNCTQDKSHETSK